MRPEVGLAKGREVSLWSVAQEIGVADEETLVVVIRVDKPAGDSFGTVAADLAGIGMEDIDAVDFYQELAVNGREDIDVRFAEDHEQIALSGVLEVVGHVELGVHPGLEDRYAAEFIE
jgi:hypothetical protein